jgi:hypothetical protein
MVPEYLWDSTPVVVNGRTVLPCALVDAAWLAEHPEPDEGLSDRRETSVTFPET